MKMVKIALNYAYTAHRSRRVTHTYEYIHSVISRRDPPEWL